MKQEAKIVTTKLAQAGILLCLAILIPFVAFGGGFIPSSETLPTWFQRSGSLVTIFSVFAEIIMFKIPDIIYSDGNASPYPPFDDDTIQEKIYISFKYVGLILIVFGTFIWGYGDILLLKYT